MAVSLGKRKRRSQENAPESSSEDEQDLRARFQKAFEAKFRPLEKDSPPPPKTEALESDEDDAAEDSDWSGFSEAEDDEDEVQITTHSVASSGLPEQLDRSQQRAYMSSKPPTSSTSTSNTTKNSKQKSTQDGEGDTSEQANLKNDLALQRLLKESHLLSPSTFSSNGSTSTQPSGKSRRKALDLRLQSLGSKDSLSAQEKMPYAQRKGIASKAAEREGKRRSEAKEGGIVLERPTAKGKASGGSKARSAGRRERNVGGPSVGKFRGGTLKLSGRDVREIEGPKTKGKGKGKGGKGRR